MQSIRNIVNEGNKVMLAVDINKHVIEGKLPAELRKISVVEVFVKNFNSPGPTSHMKGSKLIDGVWATNELAAKEVSIFLSNFRASNHKLIIVDLDFNQVIERGARMCDPSMRRLICKNN